MGFPRVWGVYTQAPPGTPTPSPAARARATGPSPEPEVDQCASAAAAAPPEKQHHDEIRKHAPETGQCIDRRRRLRGGQCMLAHGSTLGHLISRSPAADVSFTKRQLRQTTASTGTNCGCPLSARRAISVPFTSTSSPYSTRGSAYQSAAPQTGQTGFCGLGFGSPMRECSHDGVGLVYTRGEYLVRFERDVRDRLPVAAREGLRLFTRGSTQVSYVGRGSDEATGGCGQRHGRR